MESSSLYPPNSQSLSDQVIGDVLQHVRPSRKRFVDSASSDHEDDGARQPCRPRLKMQAQTVKARQHHRRTDLCVYDTNGREKKQVVDFTGKKQYKNMIQSGVTSPRGDDLHYEREKRRREVSRVNQARYRERQLKLVTDLEAGVRRLQHEVRDLEKHRASLSIDGSKKYNVWTVATEYINLFRHGISSFATQQQTTAKEFLRATMAPDVSNGDVNGVDALLANWKLFTLYFDDVCVDIERLEKIGEDSIIARTTTSVTFSENALRRVFPHLNSDRKGGAGEGEWLPLAAKLLGQRVAIRGSVRFGWDARAERVTSMHTRLDMLTPIFQLLGNLEDVSCVFESAMVSPDGRLVGEIDL